MGSSAASDPAPSHRRKREVRFTLGVDLESKNGLDRTASLLGTRPVGARGHRPARVHESSEINMRLGRFGPRTAHPTQLGDYHIELPASVPYAPRCYPTSRPHVYTKTGTIPEPGTTRAGTIPMDLGAIVCFMTDRLARGPD